MLPFRLLLITDWSLPDCLDRVRDALTAGPGIAVQHRHPGAIDRLFYEEAVKLREVCGQAPLFINGRLDIALALDAHLHLTSRSLQPEDVRPHLGPRWLSAAWHPPEPEPRGVDLLLMSPVYPPKSKADTRAPLGPAQFRALAAKTQTPCFALGGISAERVSELQPVQGVAVIGEVLHAANPRDAAEALLRSLSS